MGKNEIAQKLKSYRHQACLTGTEVIEKLKAKGFLYTVKALYNWETGRSQPDCDTFIALCDIYGIEDIMSAFGYEKANGSEISAPSYRKILMDQVQGLDEDNCKIVSAYIDGLMAGGKKQKLI